MNSLCVEEICPYFKKLIMNYKLVYRKFETIKCNYQQIKSNQIHSKLESNLEIITKQALTTLKSLINEYGKKENYTQTNKLPVRGKCCFSVLPLFKTISF